MENTLPENPVSLTPITSDEPALPVLASELVGPLIEGMPEVTKKEKAPEKEPVKAPGLFKTDLEKQKIPFLVDDVGEAFDPANHKTDEQGNPVKNKNGRFYSKYLGRGGSKRKAEGEGVKAPPLDKDLFSTPPTFEGIEGDGQATPAGTDAKPGAEGDSKATNDASDGLALLAVPTFDAVLQGLFTPAIGASAEQMERIRPFAANYLRQKNMKDIPPGWALTLILCSVYGPNFSKPTVKERVILYWLKVKNLFGGKKQ